MKLSIGKSKPTLMSKEARTALETAGLTRRGFLEGAGALIVSFCAAGAATEANAQTAAAANIPVDQVDSWVAITRTDEPQLRSWSLVAFRFDGGKLVKAIDPTALYQVSSANARWIGAEVRDVDLYLELATKADAIEVGGLLTTRSDAGTLRDVVVISTFSVAHRRGKSAVPDGGSAEPPDAGAGARDGSASAAPDPAKP